MYEKDILGQVRQFTTSKIIKKTYDEVIDSSVGVTLLTQPWKVEIEKVHNIINIFVYS